MSIDYFGVLTDDPKRIGELIEAKGPVDGVPPIDQKAMHTTLTKQSRLTGKPGGQLTFKRGLGFVSVYITPTSVQLNHNTSGDIDDILDVIMDVQFAMTSAGLNVWDPQQGSWFPGSPVLVAKKKAAPAKKKPAANVKAKPAKKPTAKAKKPSVKKPAKPTKKKSKKR